MVLLFFWPFCANNFGLCKKKSGKAIKWGGGGCNAGKCNYDALYIYLFKTDNQSVFLEHNKKKHVVWATVDAMYSHADRNIFFIIIY